MNQIQAEHGGLDVMLDTATEAVAAPSPSPGVWKGMSMGSRVLQKKNRDKSQMYCQTDSLNAGETLDLELSKGI